MIKKFLGRKKKDAQEKPQPKKVLVEMVSSEKFNNRYNISQFKNKGVKAIAKKIYIVPTPYKNFSTGERVFKLVLDVEWIGEFGYIIQRRSFEVQADKEWVLMDDYVFDEEIDLLCNIY